MKGHRHSPTRIILAQVSLLAQLLAICEGRSSKPLFSHSNRDLVHTLQKPAHCSKRKFFVRKENGAFFDSTGCPNKFGIGLEMFASEASIVYEKNAFRPQKLLFQPFFMNCKYQNGFKKHYSLIYLITYYIRQFAWKSLFRFCSSPKRLKKQFFGAEFKLFL